MFKLLRAAALTLTLTATVHAADAPRLEGDAARQIYENLLAASPSMPIIAVVPAPVPGLYTVELSNATAYYATPDAKHVIAGDLFAIEGGGFVNRTEDLRSARRVGMLDALQADDMIIFAPEGQRRGVVNVFTDVDCGYCQRLHREVPALNEMGIEVRYLAYPRAGIGSPSAEKLVSAWCAEDPQAALTRLKTGEPVEPRSCANPIAAQYRLGQQMGVRGTPALFLEDGRMLPGYMPADALAAEMGLLGTAGGN